jgi:hypothetical protein
LLLLPSLLAAKKKKHQLLPQLQLLPQHLLQLKSQLLHLRQLPPLLPLQLVPLLLPPLQLTLPKARWTQLVTLPKKQLMQPKTQ